MRPPVLTQPSHRRRILQDLSGFGYSPKPHHQRDEQTGPCFAVNLEVIPAQIMSEEDAMDHPQPTKSFSRRGGLVMIGRASRSSGELPSAENGWYRNAVMSRRHAILRWGQSGVTIQDRDSTHGTRVYRNGQIMTAREQPILLRDNDEIQFGKTVTRVDGKSDTTTACHNPLRVRVSITQPSEVPKIQVKPEPVSPEKPGKFMSHTFSSAAGGDSEDDERSVLKKALELDESAATVKAPSSKGTASTADKSDMSLSENDDEDEEMNQFTFSSPPLPDSTAGKPVPSQYKKRMVPPTSDDEAGEEEDNAESKEDEEDEDMEESEPEEDPFSSSRPGSPDDTMKPDATMKPDDTASHDEEEEASQSSSSFTQQTSEDGEVPSSPPSSQAAVAQVEVDKKESGSEIQANEEISTKAIPTTVVFASKDAEVASVEVALPRESSQQTLSGRTIHLFEPQFLPEISPTSALSRLPAVNPDNQECTTAEHNSTSDLSKTTQTTLYGFFKPVNAVSTHTIDAASTPIQSDEELQSNTSDGDTSLSPVQHKVDTTIVPVQVTGKRKRDEETVEAPAEIASEEPVKPIKKARRGFSFRSAVSHTVSMAAGAVVAVALLSVMPELDA